MHQPFSSTLSLATVCSDAGGHTIWTFALTFEFLATGGPQFKPNSGTEHSRLRRTTLLKDRRKRAQLFLQNT